MGVSERTAAGPAAVPTAADVTEWRADVRVRPAGREKAVSQVTAYLHISAAA